MNGFLYEKFLEDRRVYLAARAFWFRQARRIFPDREILPPYLSERFANGELFFDGNPIFNVINQRTNRAARIVQESPIHFDKFYSSWEQETELGLNSNGRPVKIAEKVIVLTLTSETLEKSTNELRIWLQG
ncbi:MAG TPA: hypothetical protein VKC56_12955 [Gallionellaceae bacterium]|nr:hypothetical protein [Gallionellaceae bacterium]